MKQGNTPATIYTLETERAVLRSCPCKDFHAPALHRAEHLSSAEFHTILESRQPLIVSGIAPDDWPARQKWNHSFFADLFTHRDVLSTGTDADPYTFFGTGSFRDGACPLDLPRALQGSAAVSQTSCVVSEEFYAHDRQTVTSYFERVQNAPHAYASFTANDQLTARLLQNDLHLPRFLSASRVRADYLWLFLGKAAPWAHVRGAGSHHDDFATAALVHLQLHGRKAWVLRPPPECSSVCEPMHFAVDEGDAFAFNGNYWRHSTYLPASQDEHISVALFYCPSAAELNAPTCEERGVLKPHETPSMVIEACRRQAGIFG